MVGLELEGVMSFNLPGVKSGGDLERLFTAVGFLVIQWGHTEQNLDLIVARLFHSFGGHPLFKHRPRNLEPKVEFLRKCFEQLPELTEFRVESDLLFARFLKVGKLRNDIVHGGITDLSMKNGAFVFSKIDVVPKVHHNIRQVLLSESDWPTLRKELLRLGKDVQTLYQRVRGSLTSPT